MTDTGKIHQVGESGELPLFLSAGDTAFVVEFGREVDRDVNHRVTSLAGALGRCEIDGVTDIVPTFRSLMVHYDPVRIRRADLQQTVKGLLSHSDAAGHVDKTWTLPVCYEGECAPDLEEVARKTGLDPSEVIRLHSGTKFEVYMMGFLPGFPYMGVLPPELELPRLTEPRVKVPARSVSIAMNQCVIYALESPGGWNLIGRTPVEAFDIARETPILLSAGDFVRFEPISLEEYRDIRARVEDGSYTLEPAVGAAP